MSAFVARSGRVDADALLRALATQRRRAPDNEAIHVTPHFGLAHAALHIGGEEPPQPFTLDGQCWIVADARIDDRDTLAETLGCDVAASDVELILRAWLRWSDEAPRQLTGDFAFVIADDERLFAARDPFGVKPLFYAEVDGELLVASSIAMLRAFGDVSDALDDFAIASFLLGGLNEYPIATTFAAIRRLPPAHTLSWRRGAAPVTRRYWSPPLSGSTRFRDERQYVERFRDTLDAAVRDRIRGTSAAALMSGGMDSTSVAVTAQQFLPTPLQAYTLSYRELLRDDEAEYAARVAQHAGMSHHVISRDPYDLFAGDLLRAEPYDDAVAAPFLEALRDASQHARVLFTGQGGDVVFYTSHGYLRGLLQRFRLVTFARELLTFAWRNHTLPPLNLRAAIRARLGLSSWQPAFPTWIRADVADRFELPRRFVAPVAIDAPHPHRPEVQRLLGDPNWSLLFEVWDPGQTGLPLELVHPLFDRRVVELLLGYPPLPWFANKHLLREAMRGRLPEEVRSRPKTPLPASPLRLLIARERQQLLAELGRATALDRWVDRDPLAAILRDDKRNVYSDYLVLLPFALHRWLVTRHAS